jgi:hypothetical protein
MPDLFRLILGILASRFKARATLEAENLVLRQQVNALRRRTPKRPHLNNTDRFAANMAAKRAADPDYRETEREAVKRRMRRLRRVRQKNGISGNSHRDSTALSSVR